VSIVAEARYDLNRAFYMKAKRINNGSAPLEIPKRALLETQVKQSLTWQVRIWGKKRRFLTGSVLVVVIFVIALLSAVTMGILQMNTEEIQLMQNQIFAAQALSTAEAGLNDAFARIRGSGSIDDFPFTKSFNSGSYTVSAEGSLPDPNIISRGTSSQGFNATVKAYVTVGTSSPYVIRIDNLRVNE
jgi:hypothetical protein